jgi:hypothetical protein
MSHFWECCGKRVNERMRETMDRRIKREIAEELKDEIMSGGRYVYVPSDMHECLRCGHRRRIAVLTSAPWTTAYVEEVPS